MRWSREGYFGLLQASFLGLFGHLNCSLLWGWEFLNLNEQKYHLEGLLTPDCWSLFLCFWFTRIGQDLRVCVSNKFSAIAAAGVGTTPGEPPLQFDKAHFALEKDIIVASGSLTREPGEGRESVEARAGILRGRWLLARV